MSPEDARRFKFSALAFSCGFMKLAVALVSKRILRWKVRPKWHQLLCHLVPMLPLNPRYFSNYLDEDQVRRTKQLAVRRTPAGMCAEVCARYTVQMCLRWAELYGDGLRL